MSHRRRLSKIAQQTNQCGWILNKQLPLYDVTYTCYLCQYLQDVVHYSPNQFAHYRTSNETNKTLSPFSPSFLNASALQFIAKNQEYRISSPEIAVRPCNFIYLVPLSSIDDSDAESSEVEIELVSHKLLLSGSTEYDVGLFKCQYMMLAVKVSIIFWLT